MNMLRWITLFALCALYGACGDGAKPAPDLTSEMVTGIWRLKSWSGEAQNPDGTTYTFPDVIYVYVALNKDYTYSLYQNVSALGAVKFTGSYALDGSTIRGFYKTSTGSKAWSDSYIIGNLANQSMTWTASNAAGDVQQYVRVDAVPQEVIDQTTEVRSAGIPPLGGIW